MFLWFYDFPLLRQIYTSSRRITAFWIPVYEEFIATETSQLAHLEQYRFNLWPFSYVGIQDDTFLGNSFCGIQYVDHGLLFQRWGEPLYLPANYILYLFFWLYPQNEK